MCSSSARSSDSSPAPWRGWYAQGRPTLPQCKSAPTAIENHIEQYSAAEAALNSARRLEAFRSGHSRSRPPKSLMDSRLGGSDRHDAYGVVVQAALVARDGSRG